MTVNLINQHNSLYAMRLSGNNTTGVLGIIVQTGTKDRPTPPQPYNGFDTSHTPFGNGHVFALSLGGTDEPRNLVPQWEQWQQTGAWRNIETACEQFSGHLFRCDIAYDAAAAQTYATTQSAFAANPLVAWADPRLPVSFHVRVYHLIGAQARLAALGTDGQYDSLLATLNGMATVFDSNLHAHVAMPAEDTLYWQGQVLSGLAKQLHGDFIEAERARIEAVNQVMESSISLTHFVLHPDTRAAVQGQLHGFPGFSATDISGLQVERILRATHQGSAKKLSGYHREFKTTFKKGAGFAARLSATVARQKTAREQRAAGARGII